MSHFLWILWILWRSHRREPTTEETRMPRWITTHFAPASIPLVMQSETGGRET